VLHTCSSIPFSEPVHRYDRFSTRLTKERFFYTPTASIDIRYHPGGQVSWDRGHWSDNGTTAAQSALPPAAAEERSPRPESADPE
jgi:hypothetical protein